ncbi:CobW/P47K family protein [Marvinbryantia formatexigens DSM 14469]|uniref:CobW/P47K family protein n=2 Tax=Marvinbryantia TaxID=248744 RepID=C6LJC1_9FIRM|nr:CobW/P47K family protein [Marvinbryantia formatexigens DSM 14469]
MSRQREVPGAGYKSPEAAGNEKDRYCRGRIPGMIKIDLITGFLGAGKTTFIKKYAKHLMKAGQNICILENDYGAVNVDMMLLQELEGDQCELEMVAGACDKDCHRRRFKTKLIAMGMCGYDRVLVEPSGIFDVDEFFDALCEEPLDNWYEIGNVIAIVDAGLEDNLSRQSDYLLASEVADAGMVIFSRSQEVSAEAMEKTTAHLNRAMEQARCRRRFQNEIFSKPWDALTEEDWKRISACGYRQEAYEKYAPEDGQGYSSVYFMDMQMPVQELRTRVEKLLSAADCGNIVRVKGFMQTEDGGWIELNATHREISITQIPRGQNVIIVIGEELVKEKIGRLLTETV